MKQGCIPLAARDAQMLKIRTPLWLTCLVISHKYFLAAFKNENRFKLKLSLHGFFKEHALIP